MHKRACIVLLMGLAALLLSSGAAFANKGQRVKTFFVLSTEKIDNGVIKVISSRMGPENTYSDLSVLKLDCRTKKYYDMGLPEGEKSKDISQARMQHWIDRAKWTTLVAGANNYAVVNFVCNKYM